jgi:hypothetical protein
VHPWPPLVSALEPSDRASGKVAEESGRHDGVVLDRAFSPSGFFAEPIHAEHGKCRVEIENGMVEAVADPATREGRPGMQDRLHMELNRRSLSDPSLAHKADALSWASACRLHRGRGTSYRIVKHLQIRNLPFSLFRVSLIDDQKLARRPSSSLRLSIPRHPSWTQARPRRKLSPGHQFSPALGDGPIPCDRING